MADGDFVFVDPILAGRGFLAVLEDEFPGGDMHHFVGDFVASQEEPPAQEGEEAQAHEGADPGEEQDAFLVFLVLFHRPDGDLILHGEFDGVGRDDFGFQRVDDALEFFPGGKAARFAHRHPGEQGLQAAIGRDALRQQRRDGTGQRRHVFVQVALAFLGEGGRVGKMGLLVFADENAARFQGGVGDVVLAQVSKPFHDDLDGAQRHFVVEGLAFGLEFGASYSH